MISKIITGERLQKQCNIYLGFLEDFYFNPSIYIDKDKHVNLNDINEPFNNPKFIFCYPTRLEKFLEKIYYFKNEFILLTHNSDFEIKNIPLVLNILNCDKLMQWYAQNLCFEHDKLKIIPIGFANSQWEHGKLSLFNDENFLNSLNDKSKNVYFNFSINTNINKRQICYESLINKLEWLPNTNPYYNLIRLKDYKFCICPEGNGCDTHRLWEALYLKCVPIVLNSDFINVLKNQNIPLVILNSWEEFKEVDLNYEEYLEKFNDETFNKFINVNSYFIEKL